MQGSLYLQAKLLMAFLSQLLVTLVIEWKQDMAKESLGMSLEICFQFKLSI